MGSYVVGTMVPPAPSESSLHIEALNPPRRTSTAWRCFSTPRHLASLLSPRILESAQSARRRGVIAARRSASGASGCVFEPDQHDRGRDAEPEAEHAASDEKHPERCFSRGRGSDAQ